MSFTLLSRKRRHLLLFSVPQPERAWRGLDPSGAPEQLFDILSRKLAIWASAAPRRRRLGLGLVAVAVVVALAGSLRWLPISPPPPLSLSLSLFDESIDERKRRRALSSLLAQLLLLLLLLLLLRFTRDTKRQPRPSEHLSACQPPQVKRDARSLARLHSRLVVHVHFIPPSGGRGREGRGGLLLSGGLSQSSLSLFQRRQTRGLHLHPLFSLFCLQSSRVLSSSPLLLHSCLLSFATPSNKFRHIDSAPLFLLSLPFYFSCRRDSRSELKARGGTSEEGKESRAQ